MFSSKHRAFWSITLLLWLVLLTGCSVGGREIQVANNLDELSLECLWNRVVAASGIQEETTRLEDFWLSSSAGSSLERLHLVFHGLNEQGTNAAYTVNLGAEGELRWREQEVQSPGYPTQPAALLRALDAAGLAQLAREREGISIQADTIAGSIRYSSQYGDIFLLADGHRQPVEEITFRSETPWLTITVCGGTTEETKEAEITRSASGAAVTKTVRVGEGDDCEIWFLEQTAAKAEHLELAPNNR